MLHVKLFPTTNTDQNNTAIKINDVVITQLFNQNKARKRSPAVRRQQLFIIAQKRIVRPYQLMSLVHTYTAKKNNYYTVYEYQHFAL